MAIAVSTWPRRARGGRGLNVAQFQHAIASRAPATRIVAPADDPDFPGDPDAHWADLRMSRPGAFHRNQPRPLDAAGAGLSDGRRPHPREVGPRSGRC